MLRVERSTITDTMPTKSQVHLKSSDLIVASALVTFKKEVRLVWKERVPVLSFCRNIPVVPVDEGENQMVAT